MNVSDDMHQAYMPNTQKFSVFSCRMRRPLRNSTRDDVHFGPLPERGSLDLNQVLQSTYFFS